VELMNISSLVKENYLVFDKTAKLSEVVGKLKELEKQAALVFRNKKYLGLIEKRKILRSNIDLSNTNIDQCLIQTPILDGNMSVEEAIYLFSNSDADFLPFEKDKVIVGVVGVVDLVLLAMEIPDSSKLRVNDIKFSKSTKVNKDETLSVAVNVMHQEHIDHLPVFDKGELYGILCYKDIVRNILGWSPKKDVSGKFNAELRSRGASVDINSMSDLKVENFSTNENLVTIAGKKSLKEAISLMQEKNHTNILVMDGNDYKGLLTARNIILTLSKLQKVPHYSLFFVGLNKVELTEHQRNIIDVLTKREAEKLERKIEEPFSIAIHLKEINKDGKQRRFIVNLKIEINGRMYVSEKEDWDLEKAIHKCFNIIDLS